MTGFKTTYFFFSFATYCLDVLSRNMTGSSFHVNLSLMTDVEQNFRGSGNVKTKL